MSLAAGERLIEQAWRLEVAICDTMPASSPTERPARSEEERLRRFHSYLAAHAAWAGDSHVNERYVAMLDIRASGVDLMEAAHPGEYHVFARLAERCRNEATDCRAHGTIDLPWWDD